MKEVPKNLKEIITYDFVNPLLSQPFFNKFESFFPQIWPKRAAMFHIGRSGSTVLGDLLNQAEAIYWDGEVYNPFLNYLNKQNNLAQKNKLLTHSAQILRNNMMQEKLRHWNKTIYGFEVKFFHLQRLDITIEDYLDYLENTLGFKYFIILERKNYLRKIVSSIISNRKLKNFHQPSQKKSQLVQIELDIDNVRTDGQNKPLLKFLQDFHDDFQKLENLLNGRQVLKLTYEDDIYENPFNGASKVCEFLGIPYQEGTVRYGKTNPFSLESILTNYNQVKQTLQGTIFEWMLYD